MLNIFSGYTEHFTGATTPDQSNRGKSFTAAFGMQKGEKILCAALTSAPVLYLVSDYVEAQSVLRQLVALGVSAVYLPYSDDAMHLSAGIGAGFLHARAAALAQILGGARVVVACADALCRRLPPRDRFAAAIRTLAKGTAHNLTELCAHLSSIGFARQESVATVGDFSLRGDILDIFIPGHEKPLRLDFFDDTLTAIRRINADLTSEKGEAGSVCVFPLGELFTHGESAAALARARAEAVAAANLEPPSAARLAALLSEQETKPTNWLSAYFPFGGICDYLPESTVVLLDEPRQIEERLSRAYAEHCMRFERLFAAGEVLPAHFDAFIPPIDGLRAVKARNAAAFMQIAYTSEVFAPTRAVNYKSAPLINYKFNLRALATDVDSWTAGGYKVLICVADDATAKRLTAQLEDFGMRSAPSYAVLPLDFGFVSQTAKLAVVGIADATRRAAPPKTLKKTKRDVFLAPERGDYVVHEQHGIGMCEGIVSLSGSFGMRDFIAVRYKNGDILYVPAENTNLLARYSGSEGSAVQLSKIGGAEFEQVKRRVKASIKELSFDLVKLYAARESKRGFAYKIDSFLTEEFSAAFEFAETDDQLRALDDIYADLSRDRIMDRLLVGDVGFGKTEVALRAAFAAISNGKQAALLAPTTILSQQHFQTAKKRFEHFDITVECLNRFRSLAEQKQIVQRAAEGKVDLLIGTHRLLSRDIAFKNLGLLILDEEQRFGVEHKERIKTLKNNIDCLTLSATPIPRTLHMSLSGIRDISVITTPPPGRLPVETFVVEENPPMLRDVIIRELARGGQVFLVYNRVETIDFFAAKLRELVPEAAICVAHGQMDERILEKSVYDFTMGKYNVLVCTTIIENGIDMPFANTIVIFDCENFGLSQLYQLRGRVGRGNVPAYAYFVYRPNKMLSAVQLKRLNSIMEYSELGSGFKIAMRDLEIRGAGNVLGREQHGQMQRVGYELYAKLMAQAVAELTQEAKLTAGLAASDGAAISAPLVDTQMNVDFEAYVPAEYIPDSQSRVQFYQRAAGVENAADAVALRAELADIYGAPPPQVENLLKVVTIKGYASRAGVSKVTVRQNTAQIEFLTQKELLRERVFTSAAASGLKCGFDKTKWQMSVSHAGKSRGEFLKRLAELVAGFI